MLFVLTVFQLCDLVSELFAFDCVVRILVVHSLVLLTGELIVALLQQIASMPLLVHLALQHRYLVLCCADLVLVVSLLNRLSAVRCGG